MLEEIYTRPDSTNPSMSFVFRKVLEDDNDKAVDKCKTSIMCMCRTNTNCVIKNAFLTHSTRVLIKPRACCLAVSAMAERLANHFACYRPASDLFLQLLDMDKAEDAKFMLAVSTSVRVCTRSCLCGGQVEFQTIVVGTTWPAVTF